MARSRLTVRLLALALLGASTGGGLLLGMPLGERLAESRRPVGPPGVMMSEADLLAGLRLPAAREAEVAAILRAGRHESDSVMRTLLIRVRDVTRETRQRLDATLDSGERARLDSLLGSGSPGLRRPR